MNWITSKRVVASGAGRLAFGEAAVLGSSMTPPITITADMQVIVSRSPDAATVTQCACVLRGRVQAGLNRIYVESIYELIDTSTGEPNIGTLSLRNADDGGFTYAILQ